MKRILFSTDLSKSSNKVLDYLLALSESNDFEIHILHVFDVSMELVTFLDGPVSAEQINDEKHEVRKALQQQFEKIPNKQRGEIHDLNGNHPANSIVKTAEAIQADVIVMGHRRHYTLVDKLLGSNTSQTISKSKIPVLVIPNGAVYDGFNKILFPTKDLFHTEFNDDDEQSIDWLFDFFKQMDFPEIEFLHVDPGEGIDLNYINIPFPEMKFIKSHSNSLSEGILRIAKKDNIDLIAIHKSNKSFWERLYQSNTTKELLFKSKIPLLVFT